MVTRQVPLPATHLVLAPRQPITPLPQLSKPHLEIPLATVPQYPTPQIPCRVLDQGPITYWMQQHFLLAMEQGKGGGMSQGTLGRRTMSGTKGMARQHLKGTAKDALGMAQDLLGREEEENVPRIEQG